MTTAEFDAAIAGGWRADVESEPMPAIVDALADPCACGAAAVAVVDVWRPGGQSVRVAKCRDCKAVTA